MPDDGRGGGAKGSSGDEGRRRLGAEGEEEHYRQTVECMDDTVEEMAGRLTGVSRAVGNLYLGMQCAGRAGSARSASDAWGSHGSSRPPSWRGQLLASGADEEGDDNSTRGMRF